MNDQIVSKVRNCVAECFVKELDEISESTKLISELDADSLDIMDLMFQLEERFETKLEKEDFNFLTKIDLTREEAIQDEYLTTEAKKQLLQFMPSIPVDDNIKPVNLSEYLSVYSLCKLIETKTS